MGYIGTKPGNQVVDGSQIADGTITPADLSTGKPVWDTNGNVGVGVTSVFIPGGSRRNLQISNGTNGGIVALGSSTSESNNPRVFSGQFDLGFAAGVTTGNILFYTNDTERVRIPSNASGIQFPANAVTSSDANTLDDYEEGTFTPTSPNNGYVTDIATGHYVKIGRVVTVQWFVRFTTVNGSNNSNVTFSGLPFTSASLQSGSCQAGVCRENSATGAIYIVNTQHGTNQLEINSMDGVGSGSQRTLRVGELYCCTLTYFTST